MATLHVFIAALVVLAVTVNGDSHTGLLLSTTCFVEVF